VFFVIFVEIVSFAILWASLSVCILVNRNLLWSLHSTLPAHHHSFICSPCFFSVISGFNICFSISRFLRNHEFPFLVLLPLMYLYYLGLWFSWDYYVKGRLPGLFFFFLVGSFPWLWCSDISTLLARSFFMGFSLTILALLARLRVLVQQVSCLSVSRNCLKFKIL